MNNDKSQLSASRYMTDRHSPSAHCQSGFKRLTRQKFPFLMKLNVQNDKERLGPLVPCYPSAAFDTDRGILDCSPMLVFLALLLAVLHNLAGRSNVLSVQWQHWRLPM